jgi:hypothetical protein
MNAPVLGRWCLIQLVVLLSISPRLASHELVGVKNLRGEAVALLPHHKDSPLVLIFMSVECPIANRYAPILRRLTESNKEARFVLVYPHPDEDEEKIRKHLKEYELTVEAWRDPEKSLVQRVGATITPEAVVYAGKDLVYRGRIDNRYAEWGRKRPAATRHDLQEVLDAIAAGGKLEQHFTQAVGCYISSVDE